MGVIRSIRSIFGPTEDEEDDSVPKSGTDRIGTSNVLLNLGDTQIVILVVITVIFLITISACYKLRKIDCCRSMHKKVSERLNLNFLFNYIYYNYMKVSFALALALVPYL